MADIAASPVAADAVAPVNAAAKKARQSRPKYSFMLHHPKDMSPLGKFISTDYRYAALKVISRADQPRYADLWVNGTGPEAVATILLRKTKTKDVRVFEGRSINLDEPKVIQRGTQQVLYHKKPVVRELKEKRSTFNGIPAADVDTPAAP
jgi:hypothetical protein